ncbi:DUF969 domain-containing protein [Hutsoniella sourekii]|uniref:DUF969 domain-containing protein n=1 Tax=Hutsoniella sourekii TaxID=87650 RepID=UPI0004870B5B|nr:DUF969 domain-containing protein [Hutsoniella sourekii]
MEWIRLIGIVIIVLGFVFKLNTIGTVIIAGLVTALVSGINLVEFLSIIGESFVNNRIVSLFFLTLPVIGLAESYGLKQQAVKLIQSIKGMSMGLFYSFYLLIRLLAGFFSVRLGGHPQFVRPIVHPMGEAAVKTQIAKEDAEDFHLDSTSDDEVKALAAANENIGNFFGQDTFVGAGGVLLMVGILNDQGFNTGAAQIAFASIPIAIIALVVGSAYNLIKERMIINRHKGGTK